MRIALAVLLLVLFPAAALGASWRPPEAISDPATSVVNDPALEPQFDDAGDVFLLYRPGGSAVGAGLRPAGGAFATTTIGTSSSVDPPRLAVSPSGDAVAVWLDGSGEVVAATRAPGGAFTALPLPLSPANASKPAVAITSDGTVIAVWDRANGVHGAIRPPGGSFGPEIPVFLSGTEDASLPPQIATDARGDAIILFGTEAANASTYTDYVRSLVRTPLGFAAASQVIASTSGTFGNNAPHLVPAAVAEDAAGDAVVAMTGSSANTMSSPYQLTSQLFGAVRPAMTGAWTASPIMDSGVETEGTPPTGKSVSYPTAGFDTAGDALVAWHKFDSSSGSADRLAQASAGNPNFGAPANVVTGAAGPPQLLALPNGHELYAEGEATGVKVFDRPPGGTFDTGITAASSAQPAFLGLHADAAGDAVAAWQYHDDTSGKDRIQAAIYDATPPVISGLSVPATAAPGQSVDLHATVFDAFSPVTASWDFGDGTKADGSAVSHAFGAVGTFSPMLSTTDAAGNVATPASASIAVATPSPSPTASPTLTPTATATTPKRPKLSKVSVTRKRLRFTLDVTASVKATIVHGKKKRVLHRRGLKAGRHTVRLHLRRGRYRLTLSATGTSGLKATAVKRRFH